MEADRAWANGDADGAMYSHHGLGPAWNMALASDVGYTSRTCNCRRIVSTGL